MLKTVETVLEIVVLFFIFSVFAQTLRHSDMQRWSNVYDMKKMWSYQNLAITLQDYCINTHYTRVLFMMFAN